MATANWSHLEQRTETLSTGHSLFYSHFKLREEQRRCTDWLHQVIATRPLTTPRDPVKAVLTTDLTLSRTEGRLTKPGRRAGAHLRTEHGRM